MGFIQNIFSGGAGSLIKTIGDEVEKFTGSREGKMQHELEMAKAQMQYQSDLQKMSLAEKQAVYGDIDSARKTAAEIQTSTSSTKLSKNTGPILALGTAILTFLLFILVIFYNKIFGKESLDPTTKDIVIYILGVLSAIMTQIYSFYFGSSQGSSEKNDIMRNMLSKDKEQEGK